MFRQVLRFLRVLWLVETFTRSKTGLSSSFRRSAVSPLTAAERARSGAPSSL